MKKIDEARQGFGSTLKGVIKANNLSQKRLAMSWGVSEQYVSRILKGIGLPTNPQFDMTLKWLNDCGIDKKEIDKVADMYIVARTGLKNEKPFDLKGCNPMTIQFAQNFESLGPEQQIKILYIMEQMNKDKSVK